MKIHLIIDPHHKVENKFPSDLIKQWDIRCSSIELPEGFTVPEYTAKITRLIDMVMEEPSA